MRHDHDGCKARCVRLEPSRREARLIVVSIQVFWLVFGLGLGVIVGNPLLLPVALLGLACGFVFYWIVYRVAAREFGRSTASWLPFSRNDRKRSFAQRGREDWGVTFKIIDPRWWHSVVAPATGWPVVLVDVLMVAGVVSAVAGAILQP